MLEYKTTWYGSKLIVAPRYYPTTKVCSQCGFLVNKMPLSIREWQCKICQFLHVRDINAAINLQNLYIPGVLREFTLAEIPLMAEQATVYESRVVEARINEWYICP
jgi:transposase